MTPGDLARRLFEAYADGDRDTIRALLADDLTAYVTNADAGVDEVRSVEEYMERLPDLHAAGGRLRVTQVLPVDAERVMTMVEIRAERGGEAASQLRGLPRPGERRQGDEAVDGRRAAGLQRRVLVLARQRRALVEAPA